MVRIKEYFKSFLRYFPHAAQTMSFWQKLYKHYINLVDFDAMVKLFILLFLKITYRRNASKEVNF
jgi:hypothetical protein